MKCSRCGIPIPENDIHWLYTGMGEFPLHAKCYDIESAAIEQYMRKQQAETEALIKNY